MTNCKYDQEYIGSVFERLNNCVVTVIMKFDANTTLTTDTTIMSFNYEINNEIITFGDGCELINYKICTLDIKEIYDLDDSVVIKLNFGITFIFHNEYLT